MKNTVTMMTKSLQSVVSKYFNVSYHTASLARRAVLALSLVAFGLGSVWGQTPGYTEIPLLQNVGATKQPGLTLQSEYYDVEGCLLRFEFTSAAINYKVDDAVSQLKSRDNAEYNIIAEASILKGAPFEITCSLSEIYQKFGGKKTDLYMNPWRDDMTWVNNVILLIPNPFNGKLPSTHEEISKTAVRSASFVSIDVNTKLTSNPQYARFYLTDTKGNPVDPTGKLAVKYDDSDATPCSAKEKGFYIYASPFDKSKISVRLLTPKAYKLYNVVCLFSDDAPKMNNGKISEEPDFDLQYTYSFKYRVTTQEVNNGVDWRDGVLTPDIVYGSPESDWDISWEELSVGYCVKWSVQDESGNKVNLLNGTSRQADKWLIDADANGYVIETNTETNTTEAVWKGVGNVTASIWEAKKMPTFYVPEGQDYAAVNGYKIVCEIYTNSTGTGSPNARYTFLLRDFFGKLKGSNTTGGTTLDVKKGVTSLEMELEKVACANAKYARVWLTTTDGTLVDPTGKLLIEGMIPFTTDGYTDVRFGYYLYRNGDNISLSDIKDILQLPLGTYNQYQVHVALSTDIPKVVGGEIAQEPDYDYVYTLGFTYPVKTKYKTLIYDASNRQCKPILLQNWMEVAGDCGEGISNLKTKLYVRWYLATVGMVDGKEVETPINFGSWSNNNNNGYNYQYAGGTRGYYGYGKTSNFNFETGGGKNNKNGRYVPTITLPTGYTNYDNVRLICIATTKTDNYTYNNNNDPEEIQVKYVYSLRTAQSLEGFAHYEGEAYRYLKEIGYDNQAEKDCGYITNVGGTAAPTWDAEKNDYSTDPDKAVRQNVHTVHYYYYYTDNETDLAKLNLQLPLQFYNYNGQDTEPRAYFRWYDYYTDMASDYVDKQGALLNIDRAYQTIGEPTNVDKTRGLFAIRFSSDPRDEYVGVRFNAQKAFGSDKKDSVVIACDVSRYLDGMDESFRYFVHEPTLSIRYLFHILPAKKLAQEIVDKANENSTTGKTGMAAVEEKITSGGKPTILEDEGRIVVSTNKGVGKFSLRTRLSDLGLYYVNPDNPQPASSLWWYAYYKDDDGNWWRHLIENPQTTIEVYEKGFNDGDIKHVPRATMYQAKYSLKEDFNDNGSWSQLTGTDGTKPTINVGDRVQIVGCVSTNSSFMSNNNAHPANINDVTPIIWAELEFVDAMPMLLGTENKERTATYMKEKYGEPTVLDFNDFSLLGMRKPTHSYENYATVPLRYTNAQYGFCYPQLYGLCATNWYCGWDGYGIDPMHGDYLLLKSMGLTGISANETWEQGIWSNWWYTHNASGPQYSPDFTVLLDVTHEREHPSDKQAPNNPAESEDYGGFLYVDAADEARTIASLEFTDSLCAGAKIYYTAYVASTCGRNSVRGWAQTPPMLRFRVTTKDDETGESIPVVTFVTGDIKEEINLCQGCYNCKCTDNNDWANSWACGNNCNHTFKNAHWYQVYGYTTIPAELNDLLNGAPRTYYVEIDNYCDNTDGADYCVDEISFYRSNAKLNVMQSAKKDCNDEGVALNIYVSDKELQSNMMPGKEIYWRICDGNGNPVMDEELYADYLEKAQDGTPYGKIIVPVSYNKEDLEDASEFTAANGYFKMESDGQVQYYFSLANKLFELTEGIDYHISVFKFGLNPKDFDSENEKEDYNENWGKLNNPCSVYSEIFVPKMMYLSVSGLDGDSNPSIEVSCPDHKVVDTEFEILLNIPNDDSGFQSYPGVSFDYYLGTKKDLQDEKFGDGEVKVSLEGVVKYYRNYKESVNENEITWDTQYVGLDPLFEQANPAYYKVLKDSVDAGVLHLACSSKVKLPIDADHATLWAMATAEKYEGTLVCTPLPLFFNVIDELEDPFIMLGFEGIDYGNNNRRVVRVGIEQLNKMQDKEADKGYLLHIPVNSFKAKIETEDNVTGGNEEETEIIAEELNAPKEALGITSGFLKLLANGTDDPAVTRDANVATFEGTVIDEDKMYISFNFHGQDVVSQVFREGFTYRMFFQVKNNAKLRDKAACEANVEFLMKVVPKYVTWNGGSSDDWNDDKNWSRSTRKELYKDKYSETENPTPKSNTDKYQDNGDLKIEGDKGFAPMKFTYVTMPSLSSDQVAPKLSELMMGSEDVEGENEGIYKNIGDYATDSIAFDLMVRYSLTDGDKQNQCLEHNVGGKVYDCEKFYSNWAKEIYFKPGAELVHQHYLTYEKAWVEKQLVANRWYLMSTPLQNTYAGDMYVPAIAIPDYSSAESAILKGRQVTEAFQPINFTDKDKVGNSAIYSRTGYPVYQRSWAQTGSEVYTKTNDVRENPYSANLIGGVNENFALWSHIYNDVTVDYSQWKGFARKNQIDATDYVDFNKRLIEANEAPNQEIVGINIASTASPDGTLAFNTALAERREEVTTTFMENQLKKDNITNFGEITSSFTPEDWEGFQQLVEKSNIQDKDLILAVLKMYKDPNQREQEIKNMSSVFNELAVEILPKLRYSKLQASINIIGKSDEELIQLFNTNPKELTEDEILYVATLTNDNTRKMEVYKKAAELYPNSYRAYNNLGMTQYIAGDYSSAKSNFDKAKRLNPSSKEVDMNMGLIELVNGNYAKANEYIGSAAGVPEASDALGVYYLTQGEVTKANTAFGNAKTNNAALAKILSKDYSAAQSILSAVPQPDATTYYLAAIVGARTNNEAAVMSNLKKAIALDKSMLKQAQNDLEFANYNLSSL